MASRTRRCYTQSYLLSLSSSIILFSLCIYSAQSIECGTKLCIDGACNSTTLTCTCSSLYENCERQLNASCTDVADYCLNNGACEGVDTNGVNCTCSNEKGATGDRCQYLACDPTNCSNHGTCLNDTLTGNIMCQCNPCYDSDDTCSESVDVSTLPVNNNCTANTSSSRVQCNGGVPVQYCHCNGGYTGPTCAIEQNECESTPCQNGGTCLDQINMFECECGTGWTGSTCDEDIKECQLDFCMEENTQNCTELEGDYKCNCLDGFEGANCTVPTCSDGLCSNSGVCSVNSTHWSCECDEFYEGVRCEEKGPCVDGPCIHGNCSQTRVNGTLEYTCVCDEGWTDNSTCNVDINECDLDICENGGNCTNTNGSFTCQCTEFWTGDVCSEDIQECSQPDSCQNSGNCTELEGGFTCNCTGTGFIGDQCEMNINECNITADLCENSGLCVDTIGSYACNCSQGYIGLNCETRDFCSEQEFCEDQNSVSCENTPSGADCVCKDNYLGSNCGVMDPCTSNPCSNRGVCSNSTVALGFTCQCDSRFTGTTCESPLDTTTADPYLAVYIAVPIAACVIIAIIVGVVIFIVMVRRKRATRGRYSPSRHEILGPNLQMSGMLKPPPEERLI